MAYCFSKRRLIAIGVSFVGLYSAGCSTHTVTAPSPTPSTPPVTQAPTPQTPNPTASAMETAPPSPLASSTPSLDPTLLNKIRKKLSDKVAIAKQDTGKTYLSSLILSQEAHKLVKGKFSSDLKLIASDIPIETEEYRLEVRQADASTAIMVAVAKKPGFASYVGAVYAVEGSLPVAGMCKTNVPSQTPPQSPKFSYSTVLCADGSVAVN
jgi:Type IV pilin-like G and H, putative